MRVFLYLLLDFHFNLLQVLCDHFILLLYLHLLLYKLLLQKCLLEVWNLVVEDTPENQDLIVQVLESVVEIGMLTLLLSNVDGLPHVLRQTPVGFVLVRLIDRLLFLLLRHLLPRAEARSPHEGVDPP